MLRVRGSDRRRLFRELSRQGWELEMGKSHYHARTPEGALVVLCHSPSARGDFQKDLAVLKRHGFKP